MHRPPKSQVVVDTRPMAAVALAPREPTMAESMYCMAIELTSARMAGTLRRSTSCICRHSVGDASGASHSLQSISFAINTSLCPPAQNTGGPFPPIIPAISACGK